jgi:hypothetical protein
MGISADRRNGYSVTMRSKRAAKAGLKMVVIAVLMI